MCVFSRVNILHTPKPGEYTPLTRRHRGGLPPSLHSNTGYSTHNSRGPSADGVAVKKRKIRMKKKDDRAKIDTGLKEKRREPDTVKRLLRVSDLYC